MSSLDAYVAARLGNAKRLFVPLHCLKPGLPFVFFSPLQLWWHGAQDNCWEDIWLHLLPERGAGHRSARSRHCFQLQPNLPPEPASRQAESAEGKNPPPKARPRLSPRGSWDTGDNAEHCRGHTRTSPSPTRVQTDRHTQLYPPGPAQTHCTRCVPGYFKHQKQWGFYCSSLLRTSLK